MSGGCASSKDILLDGVADTHNVRVANHAGVKRPLAGIAGALMYKKVSDGIFIEVGVNFFSHQLNN